MIGKNLIDKAKAAGKKATERLEPVATKTAEKLQPVTSRVTETTSQMAAAGVRKYKESGASDKVDAVVKKTSDGFDVVSGQATFKAVQERLALQEQYNDVLANRLHEALTRIRALEEKVGSVQ